MPPRKLYVEQILPALTAFKTGYADRDVGMGRDVARAADLADLLLNLPEYIFRDERPPLILDSYKDARIHREQYAWRVQPNYELVCDFANSWKHRKITRAGRQFDGMKDVREAYAMCRYSDEAGFYTRGHKVVTIRLATGKHADLRRLLVSSTIFWSQELARLSLIPSVPQDVFDFGEYSSRDDPDAQRPLRFHGVEGEYLEYHRYSFDFDPETRSWIDPLPGWGTVEIPMEFDIKPTPFRPQ